MTEMFVIKSHSVCISKTNPDYICDLHRFEKLQSKNVLNLCYFKVPTMQYRKGLNHSTCRHSIHLQHRISKKQHCNRKRKCYCYRQRFQISQSELYLIFIWFLKETGNLQSRRTLLKSACQLMMLHTRNRNATTLKDNKPLHFMFRVLEFQIKSHSALEMASWRNSYY